MFNVRPPPSTGARPSYVSRLSAGRNLRSIVMLFAFMSGIYSLFAAIGDFRAVGIDRGQHESKLATFSLVLGILYITVFAFEAFGVAATITQRIPLVRIYAMLSFGTVLIAAGGGLLNVIVHFTMKNDIISECTNLVNGDEVVFYNGFLGPVTHSVLNGTEAQDWCTSEYDHDSWAEIVELLFVIFLSLLFSVFSYAYYRQLLDPTSAANVVRTPLPLQTTFPNHYNSGYNVSVPSLGYQYGPGYGQQPQYPPPPGPPPAGGKPEYSEGPGYGRGYEVDDTAKENPFADFDEPVHKTNSSRD